MIDIVLGADCLHALFLPTPPVVSEGLIALNTVFGWVVSGQLRSSGPCTLASFARTACLRSSSLPTSNPSQLWDLEHIGVRPPTASDGSLPPPRWTGIRYEVALPWIDNERPALGASQAQTRLKQFYRLPPDRQEDYRKVLDEWIDLGVIEPTTIDGGNYLPHHGVVQGQKLRVVVDASAAPWRGPSLPWKMRSGVCLAILSTLSLPATSCCATSGCCCSFTSGPE